MTAFAILAAIAVVSALFVVGTRNPVVSALWLALTFVAVAGIFVVLGAEFLAAIQIIVYAGAILVFFLFVIMLLNLGKLPPGEDSPFQFWVGAWSACAIGVLVAFALVRGKALPVAPGTATLEAVARVGNTEAVAGLLYSRYVWPFELASVLLTAAVVGAVVLGRRKA